MRPELIAIGLTAAVLLGCDQMRSQESVRPYEQPKLEPAPGAVPADAVPPMPPLARSYTIVNPLEANAETIESGRTVYRYYCWPCHGPNLDGNSTVGPSFPRGRQNLLAPEVAAQTDGEIYWKISNGSGWHPPLEETMTPAERWTTVIYIRARQAEPGRDEGGAR